MEQETEDTINQALKDLYAMVRPGFAFGDPGSHLKGVRLRTNMIKLAF